MIVCLTFVHIHAGLGVSHINDGALDTVAKIAAVHEIGAVLLTAAIAVIRDFACACIVAAPFITGISAVIIQITHFETGHTPEVGTLELIEHAGLGLGCTESHVVLITGILTVLHPVTDLVVGNALPVAAGELVLLVAGEVLTDGRCLI
jgi:hypothetical protein